MTAESKPTPDEVMGIAWWNRLSDAQRARWMEAAGNTGVVADAWETFKKGGDTEVQRVGMDRPMLDAFAARAMNLGRKKARPNN